MSSSSIERQGGILDYARERLPPTLFVPVAVFIAVPALSSGWPAFGRAILVAFVLVFQFRLWDDLHDREHDRVAHPERALARTERLAAFRLLLVALGLIALLLLFPPLVLAYVVAVAAFAIWYRWVARAVPEAVRYHVVLLKYPLFSYLAAGAPPASMALVYLTFVVYEPLHDRRISSLPGVRIACAVAVFLWVALAIAIVADSTAPGWTARLLAIAAPAVAMAELHRFWTSPGAVFAGRALFVVSLACMLSAHGVAA